MPDRPDPLAEPEGYGVKPELPPQGQGNSAGCQCEATPYGESCYCGGTCPNPADAEDLLCSRCRAHNGGKHCHRVHDTDKEPEFIWPRTYITESYAFDWSKYSRHIAFPRIDQFGFLKEIADRYGLGPEDLL